ncbi:hypothetical protein GF380_05855 [Candidatus Uhrbacteria bacterium]|nr:hypothetical protein [Candidatus Uhrbacteria bacterium]MBD3284515.1 hypothetical protein [Candidatus Uhrbacteria bacterium]
MDHEQPPWKSWTIHVLGWFYRYIIGPYPLSSARWLRRRIGVRCPNLRDEDYIVGLRCDICGHRAYGYSIRVRRQRAPMPYLWIWDQIRIWSSDVVRKPHFYRNRDTDLPCCSRACASAYVLWHYQVPTSYGQVPLAVFMHVVYVPVLLTGLMVLLLFSVVDWGSILYETVVHPAPGDDV